MSFTHHPLLISVIGIVFYLVIFILIAFYIVKTVRKSLQLREEHNQLLRELIKKIDHQK